MGEIVVRAELGPDGSETWVARRQGEHHSAGSSLAEVLRGLEGEGFQVTDVQAHVVRLHREPPLG